MELSKRDTAVLRGLGERYMNYASLPVHKKKMEMWKSLNRCEMQRPMVAIDQLPWHELAAASPEELSCQVEEPYWREFECTLRRTLYQWEHFPADMVLEPWLTIPASIFMTDYGIVPDEETIVKVQGECASSHHYNPTIHDMEDISKIKDLKVTNDRAQSQAHLAEAESIFQGIAPVRLSHGLQFHLGVWDFLSQYMGVENIYYDLIDRPDFLHAAMRRITDATLAGIRQANALEAVNDTACTVHCSYVFTDELLPDFGKGKGSVSQYSWAYGLAQLFSSASPEVTKEFEIPYISEMASQFSMLYYGCCDRLDDRLDLVRQIPNVRKVSCSPWSHREAFAEKLGKDLVMSNKPTPAFLAGAQLDEEIIRGDIRRTCDCTKKNGVSLELILKDISTVCGDPSRLARWNEIAMETVESF